MRIATFNIRHGARPGRPARNAATATAVASLRCDIVALQEVDRRVFRSWWADQAGRSGRRSGMTDRFVSTRWFGPGGCYGHALLVRGRTVDESVLELPGPGEARSALFSLVVLGDTELSVVSTHLQNRRRGVPHTAPEQLEAVLAELQRWPRPWCLLGDLNLRPDVVVPMLAGSGLVAVEAAPTYPAHAPRLRIDWIALSGLSVGGATVVDTRVSDHRALVVDTADPSVLDAACRPESGPRP